jgi:hypothetical protein
MGQTQSSARKIVFLSHANPEDNVLTLWLGTRLAAAGYTVWSDVTKLIGGETFWDDIEEAIRGHSVKVVSLVSKAAVHKKGFKDELSLALAVERAESLDDFVIPIRVDDIKFSEFPAEIIRRNAIDFHGLWHQGLGKLIKKLEADSTPRSSSPTEDALSDWSRDLLGIDSGMVTESEDVVSNWLDILEMPKSICISKLRTGASAPSLTGYQWPLETRGINAFGFDRIDLTLPNYFELLSEVDVNYFLEGGSILKRRDAQNVMVSLLRGAVEKHLERAGLIGVTLSNGRVGYFHKIDGGGLKRTAFVGPTGASGRRALGGFSPKKNVYWHYAPELYPFIEKQSRFSLTAHVVFSEDGETPIAEVARSHRLRRSFCKTWWQDRWRDLMLAYLSSMSDEEGQVTVKLSESRALVFSKHPSIFLSPVSAIDPGADSVESETTEDPDFGDVGIEDEDYGDEEDVLVGTDE